MKREHFFRNISIGIVDGLTIPLALAAGLSGLVSQNTPVIIACLAAAVAGAITMSIGGYHESKKYGGLVRPVSTAATIGAGYLAGGIITTLPYYFIHEPLLALKYSLATTLVVLFFAGYWESKLNGGSGWINAVRVALTGAAAAGAAYVIAKLFV